MSRRYREFQDLTGGIVQVVELSEGRCTVGYLPGDGRGWIHWGSGEGGYEATCERFASCWTFNGQQGPEPRSLRS